MTMLDPGRSKTHRAYLWAYARGEFDPVPDVIHEFCPGRDAQYPIAFLQGSDERLDCYRAWSGTLVRDEYAAYDSVIAARPSRVTAGCLAHAQRHFNEFERSGTSKVATEALQSSTAIRAEREFANLKGQERLRMRQTITRPLWEELHVCLQLERNRVHVGGATTKAPNYSLNVWAALTRHLVDGDVPVDNNHLENRIRPWAMGCRARLFAGSELPGQRAAVSTSLVQSAKMCGHDPHAYLRDVLQRLPTQLNSCIEILLPHRWQPST